MSNYEAPKGWLDDIKVGDTVLRTYTEPLGFGGTVTMVYEAVVTRIAATQVTVAAGDVVGKFRRGTWKEGVEIGGYRPTSIWPDTPGNRQHDTAERERRAAFYKQGDRRVALDRLAKHLRDDPEAWAAYPGLAEIADAAIEFFAKQDEARKAPR